MKKKVKKRNIKHIYIYIYTERERGKERKRERERKREWRRRDGKSGRVRNIEENDRYFNKGRKKETKRERNKE